MKVVRENFYLRLLTPPFPEAKYLLKLDLFQSLSKVLAQIILERSSQKLLPYGRFMAAVSICNAHFRILLVLWGIDSMQK